MARHHLRMTLGSAMLAVALIGLLIGGGVTLRRRADYFRAMAVHHAVQEQATNPAILHHVSERRNSEVRAIRAKHWAETYRGKQVEAQRILNAKIASGEATTQADRREPWYWGLRAAEEEWNHREAMFQYLTFEVGPAYHALMRKRYERAADYPWESVLVEPKPSAPFGPNPPFRPSSPPD